jgi:hypothetical protein
MSGATAYDDGWDLTPADRLLIEAKRWGSRLRFGSPSTEPKWRLVTRLLGTGRVGMVAGSLV